MKTNTNIKKKFVEERLIRVLVNGDARETLVDYLEFINDQQTLKTYHKDGRIKQKLIRRDEIQLVYFT